eukprot:913197-Pyramimonas_sp.AAC.1
MAHLSHVPWSHRELHLRPPSAAPACHHPLIVGTPFTRFVAPDVPPPKAQWLCPHAATPSLRHTPHTFRGPMRSSTTVFVAAPAHFGTPRSG